MWAYLLRWGLGFSIVAGGLLSVLPSAFAMEGFSVSTHWSGTYARRYGGLGEIWRHDVVASTVTSHTLLYADDELPARAPAISPDGARVAVLRADGGLCVLPATGGDCVAVPGVVAHPEAFIDWPSGNWVYYTLGGFHQASGSRLLRRVDVESGRNELVTAFLKDDGATMSGAWRVHVSRDLARAVVRGEDRAPEPFGRITAFELASDTGVLALDRSTPRWRCSEGLAPDGLRFMAGLEDHEGFEIRNHETLEVEQIVLWQDVLPRPPSCPSPDHVIVHNLNNWSANADTWITASLSWVEELGEAGPELATNQLLFDWSTGEAIPVTLNAPGGREFDDAGDLFVYQADGVAPRPLSAWSLTDPCQIAVMFDEPLEEATAQEATRYVVSPFLELHGARLADQGYTVYLDCGQAELPAGSQISVSGVRDVSGNEMEQGACLAIAPPTVQGALGVDAGADLTTAAGEQVFLAGMVTGGARAQTLWSVVSAPGAVAFEHADWAMTYVDVAVEGEYVFELRAFDGAAEAADQVSVLVTPARSIDILEPLAGQVLTAGTRASISWSTVGVDDVRIDYTCDGGATFGVVAPSVDIASKQWGRLDWLVPECSTQEARVRISGYMGEVARESGSFSIVSDPGAGPTTVPVLPRCSASVLGQAPQSPSLVSVCLSLINS